MKLKKLWIIIIIKNVKYKITILKKCCIVKGNHDEHGGALADSHEVGVQTNLCIIGAKSVA